jgi:hypothetical protein
MSMLRQLVGTPPGTLLILAHEDCSCQLRHELCALVGTLLAEFGSAPCSVSVRFIKSRSASSHVEAAAA